MTNSKFYKKRPECGWYVCSSPGCGEDCAVRIVFVDYDTIHNYDFSPNEAVEFADLIRQVAVEYKHGIATDMLEDVEIF